MSRTTLIILCGLVAFILGGLISLQYWQREYAPLDQRKIDLEWETGWSGPRYSRTQCMVRIDTKLGIGFEEAWNRWNEAFVRYAVNHAFRAARFDAGRGRSGEIYLLFFDACDRRVEIAQAMTAYFQRRHGNAYVMTVREEVIAPGPGTLQTCAKYWTDCPPDKP